MTDQIIYCLFGEYLYVYICTMDLKQRISAIIKVNQHTAASFADAIGVQRSSVSHVLNGRNKPSIDFIEKILSNFPRVDACWLLTGKPANDSPKTAASEKEPLNEAKEVIRHLPTHANGKKIERIVVFYADRTFDAYES